MELIIINVGVLILFCGEFLLMEEHGRFGIVGDVASDITLQRKGYIQLHCI
jgi:hypothetical protein